MAPQKLRTQIIFYLGIPLSVMLLITFVFIAWRQDILIFREFEKQAAVLVRQILATREWVLHYDGIWVTKKEGTTVKEKNGMYLKTPSIMTKEISRRTNQEGNYTIRMTALRPLNPENAPTPIEQKALEAFQQGGKIFTGTFENKGKKMYLYMVPVYTEAKCVACHGAQGYRAGDLRGGLGVILPLEATLAAINQSWFTYFLLAVLIVALVLGMIFLFFNSRILVPLRQVQSLAYKLGQGHLEERLSINNSEEFASVAVTFNEMADKLQSSYLKNLELNELAVTDGLTGLYNHWYFHETLEQRIQAARPGPAILSLALIDIDNFKEFNDTHGHLAGDVVLKKVARLIRDNLRDTDLAFRYGGEEFALIMPGTDVQEAFQVAEKIRQAIANHRIVYNKKQLQVTVSIGLAGYPKDARTKNALIDRSDEMLYKAKHLGKNLVIAG